LLGRQFSPQRRIEVNGSLKIRGRTFQLTRFQVCPPGPNSFAPNQG
jgi:hypothetical protein